MLKIIWFLFSFIAFISAQYFENKTIQSGLENTALYRIAAVDVNNDGYPDIIGHKKIGTCNSANCFEIALFLNVPDSSIVESPQRKFIDYTKQSGIGQRRSSFAIFGDVDNDGDLDMFTGLYADKTYEYLVHYDNGDRNTLYLNDGNGNFTLANNSLFSNEEIWNTTSAVFFDYDLDGKLDIFTGNWYRRAYPLDDPNSNVDQLYKGNGDGTFVNVTASAGLNLIPSNHHQPTYAVAATDWNNDGQIDLFSSNYCNGPSIHWQNNGYRFFNQAQNLSDFGKYIGVVVDSTWPTIKLRTCSWGSYPRDYDNNGTMDFYELIVHGGQKDSVSPSQPGYSIRSGLLTNSLDKFEWTFFDSTYRYTDPSQWHDRDQHMGWIDMDNDGHVDILVSENDHWGKRLYVYQQTSMNKFELITNNTGIDKNVSDSLPLHNVLVFDYDLDGAEDILVGFTTSEPVKLYHNLIGKTKNWLTVYLEGDGRTSNRSAINGRVIVYATGASKPIMQEVTGGNGHFGPQIPMRLTFGLNSNSPIDSIVVHWPNSARSKSVFYNIRENQHLTINQLYGITSPAPFVIVADAGPSQYVDRNTIVTLDGSGSYDPNPISSPLTYEWTQISGDPVTLIGSTTSKPTFTALGTYLYFKLVVSNGISKDSSTVSVYINQNIAVNSLPVQGGSVTGAGKYSVGTRVFITAIPAAGYEFVNWSGDIFGSANPYRVTVSGDLTINAHFAKIPGLIKQTISSASASSIEFPSTPASAAIDNNATTRWSSQHSEPQWIQFDLGAEKRITTVVLDWETASALNYYLQGSNDLSFSKPVNILYKTNMPNGPRKDSLNEFVANFRYFRIHGVNRNTQWGFSIYEARFYSSDNAPTYTLTTTSSPTAGGTVEGGGTYTDGSTATILAVPAAGYTFFNWSGYISGSTNPTSLTITGDRSVTANFIKVPNYTIAATAGANGSITPNGNVTVPEGSSQTFTITANSGYVIDKLLVNGVNQGALSTYTFNNVTANHTISASFKTGNQIIIPGRIQAEDYNLGGQNVGYYDATAGNTGGAYRNDDVDIQPTTDAGGGFNVGWTAAGEWLAYTVVVPQAGTYKMTARVASGTSGTKTMNILLNGNPLTSISTTTSSGWQSWVNAESSVFTLPAGTHLLRVNMASSGFNINYFDVANVTPINYSIVATAGANGSITPNGNVTVPQGSSQTFTISANSGYVIDKLLVNGVNQGALSTYTFNNVTANHTISASFKTGNQIIIPGRIQAEDYNLGGQNVGYYDATAGNTGGAYRNDDVDIQPTTDAGGGFNVGWTEAGEWLAYTVNVASTGQYRMTARLASGVAGTKNVAVLVDDNPLTTISTTTSAGWQNWVDEVSGIFTLSAGTHVIRVNIQSSSLNINYFDINAATPVNKILNGDFANAGANWLTGGSAFGSVSYATGLANWTITNGSGQVWEPQMVQNTSVVAGKHYTLSFDIRSSTGARTIRVGVNGNADDNYVSRGLDQSVNVTTSQVNVVLNFVANATDATARLDFNMGGNTNNVQIDNVKLLEN